MILNSLPPLWDTVVTSLNCSGQILMMTMDTLPSMLALEKKRKNRRKWSNLMVAQDSSQPFYKKTKMH